MTIEDYVIWNKLNLQFKFTGDFYDYEWFISYRAQTHADALIGYWTQKYSQLEAQPRQTTRQGAQFSCSINLNWTSV